MRHARPGPCRLQRVRAWLEEDARQVHACEQTTLLHPHLRCEFPLCFGVEDPAMPAAQNLLQSEHCHHHCLHHYQHSLRSALRLCATPTWQGLIKGAVLAAHTRLPQRPPLKCAGGERGCTASGTLRKAHQGTSAYKERMERKTPPQQAHQGTACPQGQSGHKAPRGSSWMHVTKPRRSPACVQGAGSMRTCSCCLVQ